MWSLFLVAITFALSVSAQTNREYQNKIFLSFNKCILLFSEYVQRVFVVNEFFKLESDSLFFTAKSL